MRDEIQATLEHLDRWRRENGWAGYDPYDFHHWRLQVPEWAERFRVGGRSPFGVPVHLALRKPLLMRRLLRLKKRIYPKAMGLFADSYVRWQGLGRGVGLEPATKALRWLADNPAPGYAGWGWGLPIDWQSQRFVPAGTPCGIVSVICGEGFWSMYRATGEARWADACRNIARGFLEDLNVDTIGDGVCFSFTPLDHFHVHNPNLWIAAWLVEVGQALDEPGWVEMGMRAAQYGLDDLRPEGHLTYWGSDQDQTGALDHYHTGFEIRAFHRLWQRTNDERFKTATQNFLTYYLKHFYGPDAAPWRDPDQPGRIDVHGCAEALYCTAELAADYPEAAEMLPRTARWILDHMQMAPGVFAYRLDRPGARTDIAYVRWGQAWMMRGLVAALEVL